MGSVELSKDGLTLFKPKTVGTVQLKHRVIFAPCTRYRATKGDHVPVLPRMKTYYEQRASVPGTLIITEGTYIADEAGGIDHAPGIWSDDQVKAWKEITNAVHAKDSYIFVQLWALGRAAHPGILQEKGFPYVSPSPIPLSEPRVEGAVPQELSIEEIKKYVGLYATAAKRAVFEAGFDGIEIHGASGYLVDQFIQDVSNKRTDEYGGCIEARSKFPLEVVSAIADAIGPERTAIRLTPWSIYQDMKMKDPIPQFSYIVERLAASHPDLAYIHFVEPGAGFPKVDPGPNETNEHFRKIWAPRPFITCGSYSRDTAIEVAAAKGDLIAFGQLFIANPDLPFRLHENLTLNQPDFNTLFAPDLEKGYIDYPFAKEFKP